MAYESDTIAQISSGLGTAGISVIRISGPEAFSTAEKIFRKGKPGKGREIRISEIESHTVHYGAIVRKDGSPVDEVMLLVLKAPRTFTTEDTVEIDCHGGILAARSILKRIFEENVRPAEPGEFTKRAFLNGRIDLSEAEAVIDIINSKNELALKNSLKQLGGGVQEKIVALRDRILHETARIEASLDDPEHLPLEGYREILQSENEENIRELSELLRNSQNGRLLSEGIRTVICGKPNAGKSSLMNAFLRCDRAIVTDIAGTTRDTLTEEMNLGGITLRLVDTAGIRETGDTVEKLGVERAKEELKEADLLLFVADASVPVDENDEEIICELAELFHRRENRAGLLVLLNKSDLEAVTGEGELRRLFSGRFPEEPEILAVSVKEQTGITELEERIRELFFSGSLSENDEVIITSERHRKLLLEAAESLKKVRESISLELPEDFFTIDLTDAYRTLGQIIGEDTDEDLINLIFREFCMGK